MSGSHHRFAPGDWVVYRKSKMGPNPGPRAARVHASSKGEHYSYLVDKFWVVEQVLGDGQLVLRTRRGKRHTMDAHDPSLRKAGLLDRIFFRNRFPALQSAEASEPTEAVNAS